ncbi:beta-lactamase/transpeptidase-like protein [Xylogone sp. PMI_703]|nr:beta-lactamase/transpeptidase-like protein [Xylogone sp. PMI_703]
MESTSRPTPFSNELDEFIHQLLRTWHVPGLTIALIALTSHQGYGFAILPNTIATPETSFTAASVSLLVNDGMTHQLPAHLPPDFSWTPTLSSVIPDDFVTFEDALSNRTSLPDHKLSFKLSTASVRDAVRSLRYLPLAADLRTRYFYSSYMFSAVSCAIETITEATEAASSGTVLAYGYAWDSLSKKFVEEPLPDFPAVSGAGAIISNVVDYAKWLRCFITQSHPLTDAAHKTLTEPRIHFSEHSTNPFPPPHSYALGWVIDKYRGQRVVWHSNNWTGYGTTMMYLPTLQWGVVMMGNTTGTSNCNLKLQERLRLSRYENEHAKPRLYPSLGTPGCPPSASLESRIGQYCHPAYGEMNIELHEIPMSVRITHVSGPRDHISVKAAFLKLGLDLEPALNGEMILFNKV